MFTFMFFSPSNGPSTRSTLATSRDGLVVALVCLAPNGAVKVCHTTGSHHGRLVGTLEEGGPLVILNLVGVGLQLDAAPALVLPGVADTPERVVTSIGL
mmetsp:Transcript_104287/g.290527  ORF Transcript_104287/g.290527 Transcript_104287/m.290527 type:complete len:99 (+) Transcript_104287:19-315(+)